LRLVVLDRSASGLAPRPGRCRRLGPQRRFMAAGGGRSSCSDRAARARGSLTTSLLARAYRRTEGRRPVSRVLGTSAAQKLFTNGTARPSGATPRHARTSNNSVTGLIVGGVSLPAGIIPYTPIPNDAEEDETALWLPPQHALAVGDILIHTPEGLRIWWEQKTEALRAEYREHVQPALRRLRELPVELILVPHGAPITTNARQALQQALEADTWQRP